MCTFDRAGCKDGSGLAAGGAAIRGSSGRSSEYYDRVPDRNSFATKSSGRTFVMYHGTTWRNWQRIKLLDSLAVGCRFEPAVGGTSEALRVAVLPIREGKCLPGVFATNGQ